MVSAMPLNLLTFILKAMTTGQEGGNTPVTEVIVPITTPVVTTEKTVIIELEDIIDEGKTQMDMVYRLENTIANANITVEVGSPSHGQLIDSMPSMGTNIQSQGAEMVIKASTYLVNSLYLGYENDIILEFANDLRNISLNTTSMGEKCFSNIFTENINCQTKYLKYRNADGSCNNLNNPHWGKSKTPYRRNLFPAYKDGISEMNDQLPNPRELSNSLVNHGSSIFLDRTIAVGIWALFIGQDMAHTVVSTAGSTNKPIECCDKNGSPLSPHLMHPLCAPIYIPKNDSFFQPLGRTCMNYVRSAPTYTSNCTFGNRDQINEATHYLDASMIYGTSAEIMKSLRKYSDGLMLTDIYLPDNITLLPISNDSTSCQTNTKCFRSGDIRVNSHPYLTALYTVWVKEHNRIARELAIINPHWNDEILFQETRRIIIAMIQHITFNEWLPALQGHSFVFKTLSQYFDSNGYKNYRNATEASSSNIFANIIEPMAYSMFSDDIALHYDDLEKLSYYRSMQYYHKNPYEMMGLHFDHLLRGFSSQYSEHIDMKFPKHLIDHFYEENGFGMDILSLSIQRSRDHGIPGFTSYRSPCGLTPIRNEEDLAKVMNETIAKKLMEMYKNVHDIDFIVGALLENPADDSMISPSMMCLITDQLIRSRIGDRYYYDLPNVFTKYQRAEIRNVTMARVLCSNGNTIKKVYPNAFEDSAYRFVEMVDCDSKSIPKMNLQYWADTLSFNNQ